MNEAKPIANSVDAIVDYYMRQVDRDKLRENLKLTPTQRLEKLMELQRVMVEMQRIDDPRELEMLDELGAC